MSSTVLALSLAISSCKGPTEPQRQRITFVTASSPALTQALVEDYNRTLPSVNVSLKTTTGALAVVAALHSGAGDIGIAQQADAVYTAYRHGTEGDAAPYVNLRGVAVLWRNVLTVVVRSEGHYRSPTDLRGKRIAIFRAGTATEFLSRALLNAYGMTYSDVRPVFGSIASTVTRVENGDVDAAILVTPVLPDAIVEGLKTNGHLSVLSIGRPIVKELLRAHPFLHPVTMSSSGDWLNQSGDVDTVGIDAMLVCREELAEEVVYQFAKEFFLALPSLATQHPEAARVDIEKAPATPIPLHAGAARYYREREVLK